VEKMAVELKEVIQKAKTKKEEHNSQGSKKNKEEKLMVGQRMWTIEEGSSKGVKRMEEDQN
jgi:hypothetical protein